MGGIEIDSFLRDLVRRPGETIFALSIVVLLAIVLILADRYIAGHMKSHIRAGSEADFAGAGFRARHGLLDEAGRRWWRRRIYAYAAFYGAVFLVVVGVGPLSHNTRCAKWEAERGRPSRPGGPGAASSGTAQTGPSIRKMLGRHINDNDLRQELRLHPDIVNKVLTDPAANDQFVRRLQEEETLRRECGRSGNL